MSEDHMEKHTNDVLRAIFEKVNSEDTFSRRVGMKLIELRPGFARSTLVVTDETLNIYKMAHGGVIFSVADQACEAAGNSFGESAVALQHSIHFLASGKSGDLLEATAEVTSRSKRIGLVQFEVRNHEGSLLATGQQIIYFRQEE
jgi:acyl-CoA thioesterase